MPMKPGLGARSGQFKLGQVRAGAAVRTRARHLGARHIECPYFFLTIEPYTPARPAQGLKPPTRPQTTLDACRLGSGQRARSGDVPAGVGRYQGAVDQGGLVGAEPDD